MISYEVTLECSDAVAPEVEQWMRNTHIPGMLATGCFTAIRFDNSEGRFRTSYQAADHAHLDRYITEHADEMREEFRRRFPSGVAVSREIWTRVQSWAAA